MRSPTGFAKLVGSEPGAAGARLTMCLALSYKLKILPPGRRLSKIKPRHGRVERFEHTGVPENTIEHLIPAMPEVYLAFDFLKA